MYLGALSSLRYYAMYYGVILFTVSADWLYRSANVIHHFPNKTGEVAIVTGGASGIGLDITRNLMKCGMIVVVASRNANRSNTALEKLNSEGHPGEAHFLPLDLSSLRSVREFSAEFKKRYSRLDALVNNAGTNQGPHRITEDGFEYQLATNYVGHFYLTHLLMDRLAATGRPGRAARVANQASPAHFGVTMQFDDFDMSRDYHPAKGYGRSKMAQLLSTRYLHRLFERRKLPVRVYASNPGVVASEGQFYDNPIYRNFRFLAPLLKTTAQGAIPITYCAIAPEMENMGGAYVSNCLEAYSDPYSQNEENQSRLFDLTMKLLNLTEFGVIDS